jgi:hypothetical protein
MGMACDVAPTEGAAAFVGDGAVSARAATGGDAVAGLAGAEAAADGDEGSALAGAETAVGDDKDSVAVGAAMGNMAGRGADGVGEDSALGGADSVLLAMPAFFVSDAGFDFSAVPSVFFPPPPFLAPAFLASLASAGDLSAP